MIDWMEYAQVMYDATSIAYESNEYMAVELTFSETGLVAGTGDALLREYIGRGSPKRIVAWGRPGSGKSWLVDRICAKLARDLVSEIELAGDDSSYIPDQSSIIPILVRLRTVTEWGARTDESIDLEKYLVHELTKYGLTEELESFFRCGNAKFIFLIDDLDEVSHFEIHSQLQNVNEFLNKYPSIQAIVAGRKSATKIFDPGRYKTLKLSDLSEESIQNLLEKLCRHGAPDLYREISKDPSLFKLLSNPYFVTLSANYWNDPGTTSSDFRIGELLRWSLDRLITRQENTRYYERVHELLQERIAKLKRLSEASIWTAKPLVSTNIETSSEDIAWYQHMEFLRYDSMDYEFTNRWIQALYAALYVRDSYENYEERYSHLKANIKSFSPPITALIQIIGDITAQDFTNLINDSSAIEQFTELEIALISHMFEKAVADYISSVHLFETHQSWKPSFIGDREIDVYARKKRNEQHDDVLVVECKYRLPPLDSKYLIQKHELEQLARQFDLVNAHEQNHAKSISKTATVKAQLYVNGGSKVLPDVAKQAQELGIEIFVAEYPIDAFLKRSKLVQTKVKQFPLSKYK